MFGPAGAVTAARESPTTMPLGVALLVPFAAAVVPPSAAGGLGLPTRSTAAMPATSRAAIATASIRQSRGRVMA